MGLVSIVIPVYNSEKYLDECMDSIVKQQYQNIEIILVNDGSTDNSYLKCVEWLKRDTRIKVLSQSNQGAASARNYGITVAKGDYICFVDSDDKVTVDYIFNMVNKMIFDNLDLVIVNFCHVYNGDKVVLHSLPRFLTGDFRKDYQFLHYYLQGPCMKLYRRDIIRNYLVTFPSEMQQFEDEVFNVKYNYGVEKYGIVDKVCYFYNHRGIGTSLSTRRQNNMIRCALKQIEAESKFCDEKNISNGSGIINAHICVHALSLALNSISYGEYIRGVRKLISMFRDGGEILSLRKRLAYLLLRCGMYWPLYVYGKAVKR